MQGDNKGYMVAKKKMTTSAEALCRHKPEPFKVFTDSVMNLKFDEEPLYAAYIALFEPLVGGAPSRPICIDNAVKVRFYPPAFLRQVLHLLDIRTLFCAGLPCMAQHVPPVPPVDFNGHPACQVEHLGGGGGGLLFC